ncbi:potassium channel family protein [Reichenbachiella versicolor]|uniref:potassium channel family protein n=1 Tax=Reichenbachiella versicolor TaxID=1821036 RepID=UPI000D6E2D72|nr:potassium channel protein [Reichenbachiella versicolor]
MALNKTKSTFATIFLRRWELKRFSFAMFLMFMTLLFGVIGFMIIEGFTFTEAFYMTVLTVSTVGFNEVRPLSDIGRLFTSIYIIFNLGVVAYVVSVISYYLFDGELKKLYKKHRLTKVVRKMSEHVIVVGFGRNGHKACEELASQGVEFVIIENNEEILEYIEQHFGYRTIQGDATSDETLHEAGISTAKAIITTIPSDAENVFLTLTARELRPDLKIIARASQQGSEKKLVRAGATHVIMPDAVGGLHMAQHITKPVVIEYLDMLSGGGALTLEEIHVQNLKDSYRDKTIEQLDIRRLTGVSIIGFKDENDNFQFNPHPKATLNKKSVLIIVGHVGQIKSFKEEYLF